MEKVQYRPKANPPYGYYFDEDSNLVVDKKQAAVIQKIFNLALEGVSLRHIAYRLNDEGYTTSRGVKWNYKILSNYFEPHMVYHYAGIARDGREGAWQPVISREFAEKIIKRQVIRKATKKKQDSRLYLLTRDKIAYCGYCGATITVSGGYKGNNYTPIYYLCLWNYTKGKNACEQSRNHSIKETDNIVLTDLAVQFSKLNQIEKWTKKWETERNKKIQKELNDIQKDIDVIGELQSQVKSLGKYNKLNKEIEDLQNQKQKLVEEKLTIFNFKGLRKEKLNSLKKLSIKNQKEIIKKSVTRITIYNDYLVISYRFCINSKMENEKKLKF